MHVQPTLLADLRYSSWADQRLLEACSALTPEELDRDLRVSHTSILRTLRHIYYAERVWLRRFRANALPPMAEMGNQKLFEDPPPEPSFDALLQAWPAVWSGLEDWLCSLFEEDLDGRLTSTLPGGGEFPFARWELVRHMVNHSTLHRGQIVALIRSLGHPPPNVDIVSFCLSQPR